MALKIVSYNSFWLGTNRRYLRGTLEGPNLTKLGTHPKFNFYDVSKYYEKYSALV